MPTSPRALWEALDAATGSLHPRWLRYHGFPAGAPLLGPLSAAPVVPCLPRPTLAPPLGRGLPPNCGSASPGRLHAAMALTNLRVRLRRRLAATTQPKLMLRLRRTPVRRARNDFWALPSHLGPNSQGGRSLSRQAKAGSSLRSVALVASLRWVGRPRAQPSSAAHPQARGQARAKRERGGTKGGPSATRYDGDGWRRRDRGRAAPCLTRFASGAEVTG